MTKDFADMLELFACGATGRKYESHGDLNFNKIIALSNQQGVFYVVYSVIQDYLDKKKYSTLSSKYLSAMVKYQYITERTEKIIDKLEDAGIEVCILKGRSVSRFYHYPETRISGDIDILIKPENELQVLRMLNDEGFSISPRSEDANHSECIHKELGIIEVHVKLYYDIMKDVWFGNTEMLKEPFIKEGNLRTLGITDGYIYTFLHGVKHFLSNGMSVRHIMDTLLYGLHYKEQIDFERVFELLEKLGYKGFLDCCICIGQKYFGFEPIYAAESSACEDVLDDIETSGIFGGQLEDSDKLFEIYTSLRLEKMSGESSKYMTNWRRKNILKAASYSTGNMKKRYLFVNDKPYLVPVAWILHTGELVNTAVKRSVLVKNFVRYKTPESKQLKEKIELIKKLDMM